MGSLISTEAMQRCIHCTRCIRVGEEIGGIQEVGMVHRGEHSEISTFVGRAVESELSGNMIDVCPVGALLSKPFLMKARTWELSRRFSISPHDSLGANLVIQAYRDHVMRVVPFENEDVNECWISDRDRFAYEGLYSEDRLEQPMLRDEDGTWREATWSEALQHVVNGVNAIRDKFGPEQIGSITAPYSTLEELSLLARLTRSLGSDNIDFRLRQIDARLDSIFTGAPWLGMPIAELNHLDRVLVVGSFLRKDHPLMAQRIRQAVKKGAQVSFIDSAADDPLFERIHARITVAPSQIANALAEVVVAHIEQQQVQITQVFAHVTPSDSAKKIAESLSSGEKTAILIGNMAISSDQASVILANAQQLADQAQSVLGFLTAAANTVGGYIAKAFPTDGGFTAEQMLVQPLQAYFVLHTEPQLDSDAGAKSLEVLKNAALSVAFTSYFSAAADWADVMLPVGPFTETSGTFINAEGRVQSFRGVAQPVGDTRPAWKVLRVLGNLFECEGFDEETSEAVRDAAIGTGVNAQLSNRIQAEPALVKAVDGLERVTDIPIYRSDVLVRRSQPLQETPSSATPTARIHKDTLEELQLVEC